MLSIIEQPGHHKLPKTDELSKCCEKQTPDGDYKNRNHESSETQIGTATIYKEQAQV